MNLLDALATGVAGAANGSATICRRGTSTPATLYANYDGTGASTPSNGVTLDENGRAVWYVNEEVDVVVRDATATPVASFTVMVSATDVEVISPSFTGTNYTTGQSTEGNPTTLSAILDNWRISAGASDWSVSVNSVETRLQDAFAAFSGVFYNVKAPTYGAAGDGTTDDTTAVQASLTAAGNAGGGIVFFPQGTYRITSALTVPSGVSLWGAGPNVSLIGIDHATANALTFSASATFASEVRGLNVLPLQSNSGKHLVVESGTRLFIQNCHIGAATTTGIGMSLDNASTMVTCMGVTFQNGGAASYGIQCNSVAARVVLIGCRFKMPATHNGDAANINVSTMALIMGCQFDASSVTAGTGRCILIAGSYAIIGNRFETPGGGTIQPITPSGTTATGKFLAGNSITASANWSLQDMPAVAASAASHEGSQSQERDVRRYYVADNAASITVNPAVYGVVEVRRTNNGAQTINGSAPPSAGLMFTLVLNNDHGAGGGAITLGADFKGLAPFTVNANSVSIHTFRSYENAAAGAGSATKYWGFVGSTANTTP